MNTNVCFYEIKDKLSSRGHLLRKYLFWRTKHFLWMFKQTQFKRKHERSQVLL